MPLRPIPGIAHLEDARTSRAVFPGSLRTGPARPGQIIAPGPRSPMTAPRKLLRRMTPSPDGERNRLVLATLAGQQTRPQPGYGVDDERRAQTTRGRVSGAKNRAPLTYTATYSIPLGGFGRKGGPRA